MKTADIMQYCLERHESVNVSNQIIQFLYEEIYMKKNFLRISASIMGVFFVVGLALIFSASSIGLNAGDNFARQGAGFVDHPKYAHIVNGTTTAFQMSGLVISLVGGFGLLISGYGLYKEV